MKRVAAHVVTLPIITLSFGTVSHVAIHPTIYIWLSASTSRNAPHFYMRHWRIVINIADQLGHPTNHMAPWVYDECCNLCVGSVMGAKYRHAVPAVIWGVYALGLGLACVWMYRTSNYLRVSTN